MISKAYCLGKLVQQPNEAQLVGEAEPVLRAPTFASLHEVGGGE